MIDLPILVDYDTDKHVYIPKFDILFPFGTHLARLASHLGRTGAPEHPHPGNVGFVYILDTEWAPMQSMNNRFTEQLLMHP